MIPQHNVMEKENEGRCPVGGVSPHGGEHVMAEDGGGGWGWIE